VGRRYTFIGDEALMQDNFLRNFHIQPSRILHRVTEAATLRNTTKIFHFGSKQIMIIDTTVQFNNVVSKEKIDVLILSKNPTLYLTNLINTCHINQVVIDGSVPAWKAKLWQRDADSLHLRCHNVTDKGAFVMNL
jgi:competence protein ComEC